MYEKTCVVCGAHFKAKREHAKYCGRPCQKIRCAKPVKLRAAECDICGKPMRTATATGSPRCHPCRKVHSRDKRRGPNSAKPNVCERCGEPAAKRFCSHDCSNKWHGKARQIRHADDVRVRRGQREVTAPGLTYQDRRKLMRKWIKQGQLCAYCNERRADTMDHVLPLVRGGTNYEGNLAPACRKCNSSKSGWTMIEWRRGVRLPAVDTCPAFEPHEKPKPKPLGKPVQLEMRLCPACGALHVRKSEYCSNRCHSRSLYRLSVGKPLTAPLDNRGRRAVA